RHDEAVAIARRRQDLAGGGQPDRAHPRREGDAVAGPREHRLRRLLGRHGQVDLRPSGDPPAAQRPGAAGVLRGDATADEHPLGPRRHEALIMKRYPCCLLATCCIPWDEEGNFLEDVFRREVASMLKGTPHLYLFGTAGEGYAVTDRQFDRIVRVFADAMNAGGAEPRVGVINLSLPVIIERIGRCRDMGVRQFQISLPSWGALSEREVFEFFRQTCGRFPDCQFLHYNLMRTKRLVTAREYARLAEAHPNLVATKNSTDSLERIEELLLFAPQLQHFLNETGFAHGSLIAEVGLLDS